MVTMVTPYARCQIFNVGRTTVMLHAFHCNNNARRLPTESNIFSGFFQRTYEQIFDIGNQQSQIAMRSIIETIVEKLPLQLTPEKFLVSATKAVLESNTDDVVWSAETRAGILSAMYKRHGSLQDFVISKCAGVDTIADAFDDMPFAFTGNMNDCISVAKVNEAVDFKRQGGKKRVRTDLQNLGATHRKGKGGKYYWHGLTFKPVSTPAEITPADIAVDMGKQQKALERDIDYVEYLRKHKAELSSEIDNMSSIISELRADLAKLKREKESAFCETESEDEEVDFLMRR
jgi:hypothetical protein